MPVNLDDIRKRREERRQALLDAQKVAGTTATQPELSLVQGILPTVVDAIKEDNAKLALATDRRRRTLRDEAVARSEVVKPEESVEGEEEVDIISKDGKDVAVYETPKPDADLAFGGIAEMVRATSTLQVPTMDDEFVRRVVRIILDELGNSQVHITLSFGKNFGKAAGSEEIKAATRPMPATNAVDIKPENSQPSKSYRDEAAGYKAFEKQWGRMSPTERVAYAKTTGATWNEHSDAKINNMRMQMAVREKLGIKKYDS